jgi:signal transduction histidine kinase
VEVDAVLGDATLRRLLDAGRSLVAHLDLERVLDDLLKIAAEVTSARYCAIGVLDEERHELERFLTYGVDDDTHRAIGDLPRGRGILGILIEEPKPLRLADVGEHPQSYGFPAHHPPMKTFLGVPLMIRGEAWGNLYLTEKAGGEEFTRADQEAAVVLSEWAGIAIENARLYEHAQGRRHELERAVQGLEATTAIARAVGSETDLDRVLELIVKRGRALVAARSLVLLLADGDELVVAATAGQVQSGTRGTRIPQAGTAAGDVLMSGQPERIADVPARLALHEEGLGVVGAETGLIVPLTYRGGQLGVLAAFDRLLEDAGFGDDEETLLESFAASAATAVATAKSVERERLRHSLESAERERRRWARELHDETLQALAALRLMLSAGVRAGDPATLERSAREAADRIQTEIDNLRTLITELRPAALDDLGLAPAIQSLVRRVATTDGLDISEHVAIGDERLHPDLETAIYRVVQEALSNVVKHARAERVSVGVERNGETVEIAVADDGVGFDPGGPSEGFGLVGMRERAALHGGDVQVESSPGGTTVRASFPVG